MYQVLEFGVSQPLLTLFLLVAIGSAVGRIKVRSISLGAAAVLFAAMGFAVWGVASGIAIDSPAFVRLLEMLDTVGNLGLALFTFTIGLLSGPGFFASLRTGLGPILGTVGAVIAAAAVCLGVGTLLSMPSSLVAGAFAGSVTNTPALAAALTAAGDPATNSPTIGYSVTYVVGVLGVLAAAMLALRQSAHDDDAPVPLANLTVRVDRGDRPRVRDIEEALENKIAFSLIRRGDANPDTVIEDDQVLEAGDLVTVVGPRELIQQVARDLGHSSSHNLHADRRFVDLRRITLSNTRLAGRTIKELELDEKFGAMVTRVRRGDVDMLAHDELVVQIGDRLRVIMPAGHLKKVSAYLGDSARGLSDINPITLGLGMAVGVGLGMVHIPIGAGFTLGAAAGTLLVGLVMGRVGRIGPLVTTMPHTAATVLSELGLLVFLAFAGVRAGGQIATYWEPKQILGLLGVGVATTATLAIGVYAVMRRFGHMGGTKLAGVLAGAQTQPAILAYANDRTGFDARVALGYALVYPASMVVKILAAQVLGGL